MKKYIFIFLALFLVIGSFAFATTIWQERNIYNSSSFINEGSTVLVNVNDLTAIRFNLQFADNEDVLITSAPDQNITSYLPKVNTTKSVENKNKSSVAGRGSIKFNLATTVTRKIDEKNYAIQGSREYVINGKANRISISGIINPEMLKGNSIDSTLVVNLRIAITAKVLEQSPQIKKEIIENSADSSLSEEEKQIIINQYLQKMINEINR